ncbi:YktB family protein [Texcoconibacillus texcoconensis]|uniref:UPF0637 protein HNQ41_000369 n=1 Tax=Texcoconibacillus texcoconensis TaxID=1095777 RepID=A0A840QLI2_9BACI|nr:DUF1054 domain-containing protein [Texcoconibacillus texcoconensis]MBB5172229.1 uncharacterized protein YktB (UPF0637 family) [Texcoconibacillus texcoconensis]
MTFNGFTEHDFDTFYIEGLDERMDAIRERIQPKFRLLGETLADELSMELGQEMFLHIAKHARRKVNPPNDTWLSLCHDKRGYKKHPHFQVGLFDDHLFIWLAFIYELPNKQVIAQQFLDDFEQIQKLPESFVVSLDHTQKDSTPIRQVDEKTLERFRDVKKAEFLVGQQIDRKEDVLKDGKALTAHITETFQLLKPLYQQSFQKIK